MKFLNAELGWVQRPSLPWARAVDTLDLARRRFPGAQNSLDALCRRFGVDNSGREKHGALLDSELLAEVYLELMGGRQPDLTLTVATAGPAASGVIWVPPARPRPLAPRLTLAESEAHARFVATLGEAPLWGRA
jgi:DNA polymerase-3 subunit epsilon